MKSHLTHSLLLLAALTASSFLYPSRQLLAQDFPPSYDRDFYERIAKQSTTEIQDSSLDYLGRWGWGLCRGMATMGNYVFTGSGPTILWLDFTDKQRPIVVWEKLTRGVLKDFIIQDSIGYVITGYSLVIVDFRTPETPVILSELDLQLPFSLAVEGSFAYVKGFFFPVFCIDVSNLASPYVRSSVLSGARWGPLAISNHNLYVCDQGGFNPEHVDVSNPDNMISTSVSLPYFIGAAQVRDSLLFVHRGALFEIFSISMPAFPVLLSSTPILANGEFISSIGLRGNLAFIGTVYGKIVSVDFSDLNNPIILGDYTPPMTPLSTFSLVAVDSALYCSYGTGLTTFSVANPASISVLSLVPTGHESPKVIVKNNLAYVTSGMAGLWVVDMSDPAHPRRVGHFQTPGYAYDLIVDSTVAYVSCNLPYTGFNKVEERMGVWAIDVSQPDSLRVLSTYLMHSPFAMAKSGSLLFVTQSGITGIDTTLSILDVKNPSNMQLVGYVRGGYNSYEIACKDSIAYVASADSGLRVFDCRIPGSPRLLSSAFRHAWGVSLSGQRAYVNGRNPILFTQDSLFVFDIADSTVSHVLGKSPNPLFASPKIWESVVSENVVFWAANNQFGAIDVSNPYQPNVIIDEESVEWAGGIHVVGDTMFLTDGYGGGLWVLRYTPKTNSVDGNEEPIAGSIRLYPNYPNPFNGTTRLRFASTMRQHVQVDVFNLLGEHISTVFNAVAETGDHDIEFDASDLTSGVYFYRMSSEIGSVLFGRMVLLK